MQGLIFVKPHGELIVEGIKKIFVIDMPIGETPGPLLVVQGDLAMGEVKLGKPYDINLDQFNSLRDRHQVSENERRRWWPRANTFKAYDIELTKVYKKPIRVFREWATSVRLQEVLEKNQHTQDLLKRIFSQEIDKYKDDDLLQAHRLLHVFYQRKVGGDRVVTEGKIRSVEDLVNRHTVMVNEIKKLN